jgi:hypothetical protein
VRFMLEIATRSQLAAFPGNDRLTFVPHHVPRPPPRIA